MRGLTALVVVLIASMQTGCVETHKSNKMAVTPVASKPVVDFHDTESRRLAEKVKKENAELDAEYNEVSTRAWELVDPNDPAALKRGALVVVQRFVERELKAPATAQWPSPEEANHLVSDHGDLEFGVFSWVDSQNSFGALLRTQYLARVRYEDPKSGKWRLISLRIFH